LEIWRLVGFGHLEINGFWIIGRLMGFGNLKISGFWKSRLVEVCRHPKLHQIGFWRFPNSINSFWRFFCYFLKLWTLSLSLFSCDVMWLVPPRLPLCTWNPSSPPSAIQSSNFLNLVCLIDYSYSNVAVSATKT
jgi:hypothetical protein